MPFVTSWIVALICKISKYLLVLVYDVMCYYYLCAALQTVGQYPDQTRPITMEIMSGQNVNKIK